MEEQRQEISAPQAPGPAGSAPSRRDFLAKSLMGFGVVASFGLFTTQWIYFIFPRFQKLKTRRIYAGKLDQYHPGGLREFYDLEGKLILVKRSDAGLKAFDSTCPHLGCQVKWQGEEDRFFCPCHNGVFAPDGTAVSGPPADAGQHLVEVPVHVDETSGIVYLEVKDVPQGGSRT